jgi:hypothetical protein
MKNKIIEITYDPPCQYKLTRILGMDFINKKEGTVTSYDFTDSPLVCGIPKSMHEGIDEFGHEFQGEQK